MFPPDGHRRAKLVPAVAVVVFARSGRCRRRQLAGWLALFLAVVLPVQAQEYAWTLKSTTGPSPRSGHAMAYDSARGRVVLFGGFSSGVRQGDTWEWDGGAWAQRATTGPTPRVLGPAMAYDSARQRVVLFGGFDGQYRDDTWEWDGSTWTQRAVTGPSARNAHALAYDTGRGRVVLFGGGGGAADTWEWDGNAWTQRLIAGPTGRGGHGMVYDGVRAATVVFGGRFGSDYRSDTWTWDGTAWAQVATTGPSARYQHAMAYDGARGETILFGGYFYDVTAHYYADTWRWNGSAWTQATASGPSARQAHAMAYDAGRNRIVLFGGYNGTQYLRDTWEWACTYQTETAEGYLVVAANGNRLWVKIIQPSTAVYAGRAFPAVVDVPGGIGAGAGGDLHVAADGHVEFHFNAEGRGTAPQRSDGVEDYNGFVHQDDLRAVIEYAHTRPNVLDDNVGVVTGSYGITMGAGCLGRYAGLQVKYLVDQEGPSDNYVTCFEPWALDSEPSNDKHESAYQIFGHWSTTRDPSAENVAWWTEREATRYISTMRARYVRMQADWDHAQPPNAQWPGFDYPPLWWPGKHAMDLVNPATGGRSEWTRVNGASLGNAPNTTYDHEHPPVYYSGRMADHPNELAVVLREMVDMPPLPPLCGDFDDDGDVDLDDYAVLASCLTGPDGGVLSGCQTSDLEEDGDTDLADFGEFQRCFADGL
jgi:hypothetical protein